MLKTFYKQQNPNGEKQNHSACLFFSPPHAPLSKCFIFSYFTVAFFTLLFLLFFSHSVKLSVCFSPQTQNKEGVISKKHPITRIFFIILLIKLYFTYIFVYCFFFYYLSNVFLPINMTLINDILFTVRI